MINERDKARLEKIGRRIRELREAQGLSQDELASRCNVDRAKISKMENATANYYITTLIEVASGLNIPVKKLMDMEL
jgi:transcriptional regulator with XRE-family HTH domain